jgi:biotin carboxyl carrier protein
LGDGRRENVALGFTRPPRSLANARDDIERMSEKIITIGGEQRTIALSREGEAFVSGDRRVEVIAVRSDEAEIRVDGRIHIVPFVVQGTQVSFAFQGEIYVADVAEKGARTKPRHRDHSMSAPMPGIVLKILVGPGDVVTKGTPLVILEAMKMEHSIAATRDGKIVAVNCTEGELVQPGLDLIEMEG